MASQNDLQGKVCLVTGASSGIGQATALDLARRGATVVLHARSAERGRAAQTEIVKQSGNAAVDLLLADITAQAAVRQLAADFKSKYARLDILINNAGVNSTTRAITPEGIESIFAVNYLAPFLLTHLLLEALQAGAPARVVNLGTWIQPALNLDDVNREQKYDPMAAYSESKTALTMFTYEMARRLAGTGVTINIVNPGLIRTNLGRDARGGFRLFLAAMQPFMKSAARAAEDVMYLATSPRLAGVSGQFFTSQKPTRTSPESYDAGATERLWRLSEQLTGLAQPAN